MNRKSRSAEYSACWFGDFHLSEASRTKPFEHEDYEWREWFGGREGTRRRENDFFILHEGGITRSSFLKVNMSGK